MDTSFRGAHSVVRTLRQAGVEKIFTLSGNHVMPIYDALRDTGIELYHVRHEGAAVHMADAYARVTGKIGVALVTGGPGHANAVGALYTAQQGETPVLLLSGHAPLKEIGNGAFQEMRQAEIAAPLTKASWNVLSADDLADDLARAIRMASEGRPGPVHLSLPSDILESPAPCKEGLDFTPRETSVDDHTMNMLLGQLQVAKRPLVILPPAFCTERGMLRAEPLSAFGLPVVRKESPRGINDPALGGFASLLHTADLVILLGKGLDFTLNFGDAAALATWIVVDADDSMLRRARDLLGERLVLAIKADPATVIRRLVPAPDSNTDWLAEVSVALTRRPPPPLSTSGGLDSFTMCMALGAYVQRLDDVIFVCDGGEIGQWAQSLIQAPGRIINGVAGAIGSAIPFALGVKAASPGRPVLAVMGDGTFGFHMAEFETAVRHGLQFVSVIGNDGRWNAEYQIQQRNYGVERALGCELMQGTRYDLAVAALGGHGELVTTVTDIIPALDRAFGSGKPACVNILIEGLPAPKF